MSPLRSRTHKAAARSFGILVLLSACAVLIGCASDPEDREFFGRGWVNPHREIDLPQNPPRAYPNSEPVRAFKKDPLVD